MWTNGQVHLNYSLYVLAGQGENIELQKYFGKNKTLHVLKEDQKRPFLG